MAVDQQDIAAIQDIEREYVSNQIEQWYPTYAMFINLIQTKKKGEYKDINGRGAFIPGRMFQNAGAGMAAEGGLHPIASSNKYKRMQTTFKNYFISGRLSQATMLSQGKNVIGNVMPDNISSDLATLAQLANEDVYQDGTGVKGIVDAATATTNLVLQKPIGAEYMKPYGRYNIVTTGLVQRGTGQTYIVQPGIDHLDRSVTTDVAVATSGAGGAVAAGDLVVQENSAGLALSGLKLLLDNSTSVNLQGLSRLTYDRLRSIVFSNSGTPRPLSTALFDLARNTLMFPRSNGKEVMSEFSPFMWICNPSMKNAYEQLAQNAGSTSYPLKRFDGKLQNLDLGYDVISYGGNKFMFDPHCPNTQMYYGDWNGIDYYEFDKWGFVNYTGKEYGMTFVNGFTNGGVGAMYDAQVYTLAFRGNIAVRDPGPFVRIDDLDPSGFANPFI